MESLLTSVLTKLQNVQITNQHCTDESVCTGNHSLTNTDKVMLISHIVVHKKCHMSAHIQEPSHRYKCTTFDNNIARLVELYVY